MQVREGMSEMVLTVGPGHSLRDAARQMAERKIGAAIVLDPEAPGPGIITERDVLESVGAGQDPDRELVADHLTGNLVFAAPDWSLEDAAAAMVRGGFRHLVVIEDGDIAGLLSMRDVVRCWTQDGATSRHAAGRAGELTGAPAAGIGPRRALPGRLCPRPRSGRDQWWSSGSSEMSRRVWRIHLMNVIRKITMPTIEMMKLIVIPITPSVIPAAMITGRKVGPGRWISSATGGASSAVSSSSVTRCRWRRPGRTSRT